MNVARAAGAALSPGDVVDRYTVEAKLGVGGMATVYLVRHNALGSHHALKVLHLVAPSVRERLVQEGRVQAQLRHPNVVAVTDIVDVNGSPGLVMEYVDGPTLDAWLAEHRPTFEQADALFRGILAGVERAHREGLVHRDLKPGNVLLDSSSGGLVPKVTDFGLAKVLADVQEFEPSHTRTGTTMGTPAYMAPEQVRDAKSVDQRADIFALGCILYELYTGESPFARPDLLQTFAALSAGSYAPPESFAPGLPARVRVAIRGALAGERDERIESCEVLLGILDGRIEAQRTANARAGWILGGLALVGAFGALLSLGGAYASWRATAEGDPVPLPAPLPEVVAPPVAPVALAPVDPEPEPMVAPEAAPHTLPPVPVAPTPGAPLGRVEVTGDATEVWLEQGGVRHEIGPVTPGVYTLKATFGGRPVSKDFVVRGGATTEVKCDAEFQMCRIAR